MPQPPSPSFSRRPSRNSRSVPPSTSRRLYPLLRAPLSRPLAPRRRPAAAPPSRTAPPARCRASLSRRTRPPPSPPVLASPASGHRRRSHAGRRRRRPGVLACPTARHGTPTPSPGRAWAGMAARRHCAARHGGAAVPRRARAGRARAVTVPCGPVGHLYACLAAWAGRDATGCSRAHGCCDRPLRPCLAGGGRNLCLLAPRGGPAA